MGSFKFRCLILFFILYANFFCAKAQSVISFQDYETELANLAENILRGKTDFVKYNSNEKFFNLLSETLEKEGSFRYPFDSLKTISILTPPNNSFRIFTWHVPREDGTAEYFGFIQSFNKRTKKYQLFPLIDNSSDLSKPETKILNNKNWYGAQYYKLIQVKSNGRKYYTLLGWNKNNVLSQKKLVDVLYLRSNGTPQFGAYLFRNYPKRTCRVILEYSSQAGMILRYEKQYLVTETRKKPGKGKKPRIKVSRKKKMMIIFQRLSPTRQGLEGQYQFYAPLHSEVFDAFVFEKGKWKFKRNVDVRNPNNKKKSELQNHVHSGIKNNLE